jgi:hypothetical protein
MYQKRPLWDSVKQELLQIACLTPLLCANLSLSTFDQVLFSDASSTGAAIVGTKFPKSFNKFYQTFLGYTKPFDIQDNTSASVVECFSTSRMSTKFAFPWKHDLSHINVLEMKILEMAVSWVARHPILPGTRVVIFSDSMVCVTAISKGRTSSPILARPLRRLSAILLSVGLKLLVPHVRSELNFADGPSRQFE